MILPTYHHFRCAFAGRDTTLLSDRDQETEDGYPPWPVDAPVLGLSVCWSPVGSLTVRALDGLPDDRHDWYCRAPAGLAVSGEPLRFSGNMVHIRLTIVSEHLASVRVYCRRERDGAIGSVLLGKGEGDLAADIAEVESGEGRDFSGFIVFREGESQEEALAGFRMVKWHLHTGTPLPPEYARYDRG